MVEIFLIVQVLLPSLLWHILGKIFKLMVLHLYLWFGDFKQALSKQNVIYHELKTTTTKANPTTAKCRFVLKIIYKSLYQNI
jgi:hypothetical protein